MSVLRDARALISKPENWRQGAMAGCRFMGGDIRMSLPTTHPMANCWCAAGAIKRVSATDKEFGNAIVALAFYAMPGGVAAFNDTHTHAEVLAAFDKAIEATER